MWFGLPVGRSSVCGLVIRRGKPYSAELTAWLLSLALLAALWHSSSFSYNQLPILPSSVTADDPLCCAVPCCLWCCSYTSKYVSVRVQNVHVKLSSWEHAVNTLADAEEGRKPYWCSLIDNVQHPDWWPTTGHVPTYDQVSYKWAGFSVQGGSPDPAGGSGV